VNNSGCKYQGLFAATGDKVMSLDWVKSHTIASVLHRDFGLYKNKKLMVRDPKTGNTIQVQVLDECADSDGKVLTSQCTDNAKQYGCNFLLDLEEYTAKKLFGPNTNPDNVMQKVEWQLVG
jgi:hypothetical protein